MKNTTTNVCNALIKYLVSLNKKKVQVLWMMFNEGKKIVVTKIDFVQ